MVPAELRAKVALELFSEVEQRVPHGKYSEFVTALLRRYFDEQTLDLQPFGFPSGYYARAPKPMLELLSQALALAQKRNV